MIIQPECGVYFFIVLFIRDCLQGCAREEILRNLHERGVQGPNERVPEPIPCAEDVVQIAEKRLLWSPHVVADWIAKPLRRPALPGGYVVDRNQRRRRNFDPGTAQSIRESQLF